MAKPVAIPEAVATLTAGPRLPIRPVLRALCCSLAIASAGAPAQDRGPLWSVAWLAGCWAAEDGEAGSGEHWMPPAGGTMFGISRTVKGGKTVMFEYMQLRRDAEGRIVFIAMPNGRDETAFVSTAGSAAGTVTFENLQHDFPQRVIYRALPGDRLMGRIEGLRGGVLRGVDFPMKRVACDK